MSRITICLTIFILVFISCQDKKKLVAYNYGSNNVSAVFHYNKGWEYIMDYGQWTLSEQSFRKAVELDSTFLVGKSVLGKISRQLNERIKILDEVIRKKHLASKDDQLLIDITLTTLELFNARDQNITLPQSFYENFGTLGENNYREFVHKYPDESYMKAEYIEFLHLNKGAKIALDSLHELASATQKELPFFISYAAILEAELGHYARALDLANHLKEKISDSEIPEPHVLYAKIFSKMDSLTLAKAYIEKAVDLDANHIIAQRVKTDINARLIPK